MDNNRHSVDVIFQGPRSAADIHRNSEFLRHYMYDREDIIEGQDTPAIGTEHDEALALASSATRCANGEMSPAFRLLHLPSAKAYDSDDSVTDTDE